MLDMAGEGRRGFGVRKVSKGREQEKRAGEGKAEQKSKCNSRTHV